MFEKVIGSKLSLSVNTTVSFFASEEASYITGQVLGVNGGMV